MRVKVYQRLLDWGSPSIEQIIFMQQYTMVPLYGKSVQGNTNVYYKYIFTILKIFLRLYVERGNDSGSSIFQQEL